ncbi:MAG: acyl carrier protein [Catonella sp.]|nr:acyl carrier protein [Catonella sp.]MDY6356129.1 acyl carrier protein [Catonella sp.]
MDEFEKVKKITADVLSCDADSITMDTKFVDDLGADSLDLTSIVMEIEDEFGIQIPDDAAMKIVTVGDAVDKLKEGLK